MNPAELERFRFQSWTQTPDKVGCLENLGEESLIDMNPAELEKFRFQSWTQTPDKVGYLENLGEDAMIPVMCMLGDGSDLRISNNLDDLFGVKGDSPEFSKPEFSGSLEVNEIKLKMTF